MLPTTFYGNQKQPLNFVVLCFFLLRLKPPVTLIKLIMGKGPPPMPPHPPRNKAQGFIKDQGLHAWNLKQPNFS